MDRSLLIICGPTATGKTSLGVESAQSLDGEIVSADSRQVYEGMDIVTGKDMPANSKVIRQSADQNSKLQLKSQKYTVGYRLLQNVPVWLTDICQPDQEFNVAYFVRFASRVIEEIWQRGKLPILVGGTGLYIKSLLEPIGTEGIVPDWKLRGRLESWSVDRLQKKLKWLDLRRLEKMNQSDRNNPRRLIRAIEISLATSNQPPATRITRLDVKPLFIGLRTKGLKALYQRIDERVEERLKQGAEREVSDLLNRYSWDNSVLGTTIGYRQWRAYLTGTTTKEDAIQQWKFAEHAYGRRQMTWFKKQPGIRWFKIDDRRFPQNVVKVVKEWYSKKETSTTEIHGQN